MTTLTDRYVWGVLRAVPERQRAELEPEIRALVADAVEAHAGTADDHPATAERAALAELGDPELLAARYTERPLHLIGPSYYPDYRRLLSLLAGIVVPVSVVAVLFAGFVAGTDAPTLVVNGVGAGINVAIYVAFMVTAAFAVAERFGRGSAAPRAWTPDQLPDLPARARMGLGEAVAAVVASALVIAVIVWQPPVTIDGQTVPLFDPALGSFWFPWIVGVSVLEIGFTLVLYASHRWSRSLAAVNALLGAAFAIPVVVLLQQERVFSPDAVAAVERVGAGEALPVLTAVLTFGIAAVAAWDAIDGFLKARRSARPAG